MSLTQAQKEFIESAIDHMLDFSDEKTELVTQALKLREALTAPVDPNHDYYYLRECLYKPTEFLKTLEKFGISPPPNNDIESAQFTNNNNTNKDKGTPATIAEVQQYTLSFVLRSLENKAKELQLTLKDLGLEQQNINLEFITGENNITYFRSIIEQPTGYLPWEMIYEEGQIHYSSLTVNPNNSSIDLKIHVFLPFENLTLTWQNYKSIPADVYQNNFLLSLIPETKELVNIIVKQDILKTLYETFEWINTISYFYAWYDPNFNKIITNNFYLSLILTDPNYLNLFLNLSTQQGDSLTNTVVINILKNQLCTLNQAKDLNQSQISIVSTYYFLLKNRQIDMNDILTLNHDECRILSHSLISNLIKQNKLSFSMAKQIPLPICSLLSSGLYMDFFLKQTIDWSKLMGLTKYHCDFLLDKRVASLILDNILDIASISKFTSFDFFILQKDNILNLLLAKKITFEEIHNTLFSTLYMIIADQNIYAWLLAGILKLKDINTINLCSIYSLAYSERLFAIYQNKPFVINEVTDNIDKITEELSLFEGDIRINSLLLREMLISQFILKIGEDIKNHMCSETSTQEKKFCYEILSIIQNVNNNCSSPWQNKLDSIIELANKKLNSPYQPFTETLTLFKRKEISEEIQKFCEGLIRVSPLSHPEKRNEWVINMELS